MIFFDTSAIVKAYAPERGSATVHGVLAGLEGKLYLSNVVALEVLGALAKKQRKGELTQSAYGTARAMFLGELGAKLNVFELREVDFTTAFQMVDRYCHIGAGPIDVLHVVSALHLGALPTFDPETEPLGALLALQR